ncbi:MAG: Na+/H+ antiporter subunit A [Bowdeniella nasicola]|nr:Na+/H+ antiporter subunit A [Bowdeniella nasicola]
MTVILLAHALAALAAPLVMRLGRRGFLILAFAPATGAMWVLMHTREVFGANPPVESVSWIPAIGLRLTTRLDPLSYVMALLVTVIGTLVLIYCSPYFAKHAHRLGQFGAVFVAFAGAMLGLVTTDNTLALYLYWELTTVFSFLLIGHHYERQASRRAAHQAMILTTAGGLAMLGGFVILGSMPGGSYSLEGLLESANRGLLGDGATSPLVAVAAVLVAFGALSKSALIPTHFWLPAAMAAPTPVSAYLHAAAMVKAGVYLVARLAPAFAPIPAWTGLLITLGLATMVLGGYRALRQYDIKLLLAFGTISQLGMMIAILAMGNRAFLLAGLAMVLAHALFKSALFLIVGVIDWSYGTRDLRELSGVGRDLPIMATAATLAAASMIGLPPFVGYVAKEAALESFAHDLGSGAGAATGVALAVFVLGAILTCAYSLRFLWGAFASKPGVSAVEPATPGGLIQTSPVLLALAGLVGLWPGGIERLLAPHPSLLDGEAGHLTLWGGVGLPFLLTLVILTAGAALFVGRERVSALQNRLDTVPEAEESFRRFESLLEDGAAFLTSHTQRGSLPFYLATVLLSVLSAAIIVVVRTPPSIGTWRAYDYGVQVPVVIVVVIAAVLAARSRRRLKAVLFLGVSGYGVALLFALHGAPDLALTQVLVETVTLVVFVLVLRRLPAYFSNRPLRSSRYWRAALGALAGAVVAWLSLAAATGRVAEPVSRNFPAEALHFGYGRNIVNVTLVDIRAWDTFGEIAVVLVAATGVASLLFLRSRTGTVDPSRNVRSDDTARVWDTRTLDRATALHEATRRTAAARAAELKERGLDLRQPGRGRLWLRGSLTLAPRRRSVIFEVGARLIFHTMVVVSLFFLFAGHNAPGGGFAGGLMAGTALLVRYLAAGRYELGEALRFHAGHILGTGLALAALAAALPLAFGGTILQTTVFHFTLPIWGEVHLATALLFDVGVYLLVIGLVVDILRSLGAEIDRHGEIEGTEDGEGGEDASALLEDDAAHADEVADDDFSDAGLAPAARDGEAL